MLTSDDWCLFKVAPTCDFPRLLSLATRDDLWIRWPSAILQEARLCLHFPSSVSSESTVHSLRSAVMLTLMSLLLLPETHDICPGTFMLLVYKPGTPALGYPAAIALPFPPIFTILPPIIIYVLNLYKYAHFFTTASSSFSALWYHLPLLPTLGCKNKSVFSQNSSFSLYICFLYVYKKYSRIKWNSFLKKNVFFSY